jgi:hypothetical protein
MVAQVYSPSCLLEPEATPSEMARVDQLAAIITPLVVVIVVAFAWMVRYGLFNFRKLARGQTGQEESVVSLLGGQIRSHAAGAVSWRLWRF